MRSCLEGDSLKVLVKLEVRSVLHCFSVEKRWSDLLREVIPSCEEEVSAMILYSGYTITSILACLGLSEILFFKMLLDMVRLEFRVLQ